MCANRCNISSVAVMRSRFPLFTLNRPRHPTGSKATPDLVSAKTNIDFTFFLHSSPVRTKKKEAKWDKFASVWLSLVWYLLRMSFVKIKEEPEAHTASTKEERNKEVLEGKNPSRQVSSSFLHFREYLIKKRCLSRIYQLITFCFSSFVPASHL